MSLRMILRLARLCRGLSDALDGLELRLLAAAKRRGWKPDGAAAEMELSAREQRQRVHANIDEVRARMNAGRKG